MNGIILSLFVVFEITFAVYCIYTGAAHQKFSSIVRLLVMAVFLILCILSILEGSIRWFLLGTLLLVLSVKSLYVLISTKKMLKQFRKRNIILKAIGMLLLYTVVLIPAFVFPQYKAPQRTGDYEVSSAECTFTSDTIIDYYTGEKRQVNVGFWFPENASGKYPLVVFSHGAFGIRDSNQSSYEELASHGYVVCSIDHPGHSFYTKSQDKKVTIVNQSYLKEVIYSNDNVHYNKAETYDLIQKWMNIRTEDINFTIDTLLQYAAENGTKVSQSSKAEIAMLFQLIDCDKIGVFGHSMGAAASVQIGRERGDVDAVINIDGPYFSEMVYNSNIDEFVATKEKYDTPILNIYSDQVWVQLQDGTDTGVYAGNKISDQMCTESYTVYLKGTKHLTLTDLSFVSPFLTDMLDGQKAEVDAIKSIELENSIILEFFDAMLKGEGEYSSTGIFEQ